MKFNTLQDISLKGKRALIRVDFNVPLDQDGKIVDDSRIRQALPTINYVLDHGGSVILMSHLGRPNGSRIEELSLAPIAKRLSQLLNREVGFCPDCIGEVAEKMVSRLTPGEVLLLENLRFHKGEEHPEEEPAFVDKLARLGDIYINDAFATAHRKHASTYHIAQKANLSACGFLIEKEILILSNLLTQAKPPFYAIIGGSKISTKIGILEALLDKVDGLIIGGGMAFTFLKELGYNIGNSLVDEEHLDTARQIMKRCKAKGIDFQLPTDFVITDNLSNQAHTEIVSIKAGIPSGSIGADIGPDTIAEWEKILDEANTIFWNGPLGVFELAPFKKGTEAIAKKIASSHAMSILGGGDSAAAVTEMGLKNKFTRLSTGGGACLEYIEFGTLPALEVLSEKS